MAKIFFVIYAEIILALGIATIYSFNKVSTRKYNYLWLAFMILPLLFFYYIIFSHTDNIPFKDDYSLLESIYKMDSSTTFSEWSKSFFSQVNQHRFGFERIVMWIIYKILGNENIKAQIIIGNSFLLGILYIFIRIFRNLNISYAYFTPLPLILFNLTYFENATWGIAAIQNTPIIFFALLTVHFLSLQSKQSFYWAILFATLSLFTSGNGLGIWVVGIMVLVLQKRWKNLVAWGLIMIFLFVFYFLYDYEIISSDRTNLIRHPFINVQYILAFWGNVFFQNIPHPYSPTRYLDITLCILAGLFISGIMAALCWKIFKEHFQNLSYNTLILVGGLFFLACTGLMLVLSRPAEIKIINGGEFLSRRYMLFGAVFLCLGYLAYLYLSKERKIIRQLGLICFIPIGIFLNINSYYTSLGDVYRQQQELRLDGFYWKNHKMLLSFGEKYGEKIGYNHPTYMINLISKLDSSGIYKLSQKEILPLVNLVKNAESASAKVFEGEIDTLMSIGSTIAQENKERIQLKGIKKSSIQNIQYFVLKSKANQFLIPAIQETDSFTACLLTQKLYGLKFSYETWKAKFPSDLYEIWVIEKDSQNNFIPLFCKKTIQL